MECVPYLFCFLTSSLAKGAGHGVLKMPWLCMELILCGFISLRNWGFLADRYLGYRWAVVLGAGNDFGPRIDGSRNAFVFYILNWVSYYRNGLFKPNMTSIISNAYHNHPEKKTVLIQCTIWV
jgi:POT family proton-dependent oligopeptide transporter